MNAQISLFGAEPPALDPCFQGAVRRALPAGAWIEHCPGWLAGDRVVFDCLRTATRWRSERRRMYERVVEVPRLTARFPDHGPGHPILDEAVRLLSQRYRQHLGAVSAAYYRCGRDSVAPHGDRVGRRDAMPVVAIVSLGAPRRFLLQPVTGGTSIGFDLGYGDLLVMGGSCQRTWRHGVPKVARAGERISVQFRPG